MGSADEGSRPFAPQGEAAGGGALPAGGGVRGGTAAFRFDAGAPSLAGQVGMAAPSLQPRRPALLV